MVQFGTQICVTVRRDDSGPEVPILCSRVAMLNGTMGLRHSNDFSVKIRKIGEKCGKIKLVLR